MLSLRKANANDYPLIQEILMELDLSYPSLHFESMWVAILNGEMIGVVELRFDSRFIFLASFGIRLTHQQKRLGLNFLKKIIAKATVPIYLYTVIPDFFKKAGFKVISTPPKMIPTRDEFQCHLCTLSVCACMEFQP